MNAKISIKTDTNDHTLKLIIFKLFVVFVFALSVVKIFYDLKIKRLLKEDHIFFKIYANLLEVNPNLLKIEDKQELLEDIHD